MKAVPKKLSDLYTMELRMPDVVPKMKDEYFCTGINVSIEDLYIRKFEPNADMSKVHHMIIFGCKNVPRKNLYPNHW